MVFQKCVGHLKVIGGRLFRKEEDSGYLAVVSCSCHLRGGFVFHKKTSKNKKSASLPSRRACVQREIGTCQPYSSLFWVCVVTSPICSNRLGILTPKKREIPQKLTVFTALEWNVTKNRALGNFPTHNVRIARKGRQNEPLKTPRRRYIVQNKSRQRDAPNQNEFTLKRGESSGLKSHLNKSQGP